MNLNSIDNAEEIVRKILAKVLNSGDSKSELTLDRTNPNWDSLKQLQISLEIEDYFGIQLSDEEAVEFFDVESILSVVTRIINEEH